MEILLILLLLAAPAAPSLAPLLSALAAIPQAAQGATPQSPAPQAQNSAMQPSQSSAVPLPPQSEEGPLLASLLQLFRPQEEQGEGGAPQDAPDPFAQLLQLFSAPREQDEKNAPQEAALAALLRQFTENAESAKGNTCAKRPQNAAEQAGQQAGKTHAEGAVIGADDPFAPVCGGSAEGSFGEAADPFAPVRAIAPADALRRLAEALQGKG